MNFKLFMLASVLLTGVGSAGAEIPPGPFFREVLLSDDHYTEISADGYDFVRLPRTGCERKMEAAMKAIELWHWRFGGGGKVNTPEESRESNKAHRLWDETRRECWKDGK